MNNQPLTPEELTARLEKIKADIESRKSRASQKPDDFSPEFFRKSLTHSPEAFSRYSAELSSPLCEAPVDNSLEEGVSAATP